VVAAAVLGSKAAADSTTIILMALDLHLEDRVALEVLPGEALVVLALDQADQEVDRGMVHPVDTEAAGAVGIVETSSAKALVGTKTEIPNGLAISLQLLIRDAPRSVPKVIVYAVRSVLSMVRWRVSVEVGLFIAFYLFLCLVFVRVSITRCTSTSIRPRQV
jgi:hypothetical protein